VAVNESFTPYGNRRNPATWSGAANNPDLTTAASITEQGYTFQTQLGLWMGMNHMNGRVEDAIIGRFMSADPYIPYASDSQSYNRYSYTRNNPLTFTDPSGFADGDCSSDADVTVCGSAGGFPGGGDSGGAGAAQSAGTSPAAVQALANEALDEIDIIGHHPPKRGGISGSNNGLQSTQMPSGSCTNIYICASPDNQAQNNQNQNQQSPCPTNPGSSGTSATGDGSGSSANGPSYWDRYLDFVGDNVIDVGPYAVALLGGVWPKSLAPATGGTGPLLGSTNPLTSVPRAFGIPGSGSAIVRGGAATIGLATVFVGFYDATIELEGFLYAIPSQGSGVSSCRQGP
jgi:RHS repeat-associated protein